MPESSDYRDLLYLWEKGFFKMNVEELKGRLKKANLILGKVEDTIHRFIIEQKPNPIGFISFDLDYYTSTKAAMSILNQDLQYFIPRTYCYFDDCVGDDNELHSEYTGELLAIDEFNRSELERKLAKIHGLSYKRWTKEAWNEEIYVLHIFNHPKYDISINQNINWQLPLDGKTS